MFVGELKVIIIYYDKEDVNLLVIEVFKVGEIGDFFKNILKRVFEIFMDLIVVFFFLEVRSMI